MSEYLGEAYNEINPETEEELLSSGRGDDEDDD